MVNTANDRLRRIEDRMAKLRAEAQRIRARESKARRARETRGKILVGAAVIAAIRADRARWLPLAEEAISRLAEKDRGAARAVIPPAPEPVPEPVSEPVGEAGGWT